MTPEELFKKYRDYNFEDEPSLNQEQFTKALAEYEKQVSDKVKKIISEKIEKYDDLVTDVDFNAGKVESLQELYTLIDIEEKL